jgi:hypothetical protein
MVDDEEGLRQKKNIAQHLRTQSRALQRFTKFSRGRRSGISFTRSDVDASRITNHPLVTPDFPRTAELRRTVRFQCVMRCVDAISGFMYCPGKEPGTPAYDDPYLDRRRSFVGVMGEALVAPRLG